MNCENVRLILNEFIDGELDELRARRVTQHLCECASCAAEEAEYRKVIMLVSGCGTQKAPEGLLNSIHIRIEKESIPVEKKFGAARSLALAASFFIVLAGGYYFNIFTSPPQQSALLKKSAETRQAADIAAKQLEASQKTAPAVEEQMVAAVPSAPAVAPLTAPEARLAENVEAAFEGPLRKINLRATISPTGATTKETADDNIMDGSQFASLNDGESAKDGLLSAIDAREEYDRKTLAESAAAAPGGRKLARVGDESPAAAVSEVAYSKPDGNDSRFEYFEAPSDAEAIDYIVAKNIESLRRTRSQSAEIRERAMSTQMTATADKEDSSQQSVARYIRGSNTFKSDNPAMAAAKCEKLLSNMVGGANASVKRRGNIIVVQGGFAALAALRVNALSSCSSDAAPKLSKKEMESLISVSIKSQDVGPDYPAILDLHFVK